MGSREPHLKTPLVLFKLFFFFFVGDKFYTEDDFLIKFIISCLSIPLVTM